MKNKLFGYCSEVAERLAHCTFNETRAVVEDIEFVARCFDAKTSPLNCAQFLIDRKNLIPKNPVCCFELGFDKKRKTNYNKIMKTYQYKSRILFAAR